jgi:hypothetical protein
MDIVGPLLENLIGTVPSTRSAGTFIGDVLGGLTNPHGALGQIGRLGLFTIAMKGGPGAVGGLANFFQQQDEQHRAEYEYGALNQLSPDQFFQKFGHDAESWVPKTGVDATASGKDAQGFQAPSRPEPTFNYPVDPETQFKHGLVQLQNQRLNPNFQASSDTAAQAQRMHLPSDFRENTAASDEQLGSVDPGSFEKISQITPEGTHYTVKERGPGEAALTADQIRSIQLPTGYELLKIPGPPLEDGTPRAFIHAFPKHEHELSMTDLWRLAGDGDPGAKQTLDYYRQAAFEDFQKRRAEIVGSKETKGVKDDPKGLANQLMTQMGYDWSTVPADEKAKLIGAMSAKSSAKANQPMNPSEVPFLKVLTPEDKAMREEQNPDNVIKGVLDRLSMTHKAGQPIGTVHASPEEAAKSLQKDEPSIIDDTTTQGAAEIISSSKGSPAAIRGLGSTIGALKGSKKQKLAAAQRILSQTGMPPEQMAAAIQQLSGMFK